MVKMIEILQTQQASMQNLILSMQQEQQKVRQQHSQDIKDILETIAKPQSSSQATANNSCVVSLSTLELMKFDGDIMQWNNFLSHFC